MGVKTRAVKLPSGRKIQVIAGQRLTREMREALDEQCEALEEDRK